MTSRLLRYYDTPAFYSKWDVRYWAGWLSGVGKKPVDDPFPAVVALLVLWFGDNYWRAVDPAMRGGRAGRLARSMWGSGTIMALSVVIAFW